MSKTKDAEAVRLLGIQIRDFNRIEVAEMVADEPTGEAGEIWISEGRTA